MEYEVGYFDKTYIKSAIDSLEAVYKDSSNESHQNREIRECLQTLYKLLDFFHNEFKEHFINATYIKEDNKYILNFNKVDHINFCKFKTLNAQNNYINIKTFHSRNCSQLELEIFVEEHKVDLVKEDLIKFIKSELKN